MPAAAAASSDGTAPGAADSYNDLVRRAATMLVAERKVRLPDAYWRDVSALRSVIKSLLVVRQPSASPKASEPLFAAMDAILTRERSPLIVTDLSSPGAADPPADRICVWRGDITTLNVDVIVNAANADALGCFQPSHACVDNVIHCAAGPRLRDACAAALSRLPSRSLDVAQVILTPAFALPSRWVAHTVGPEIPRGRAPTADERAQLQACYTNVLDSVSAAAAATSDGGDGLPIRTVAFPCISTGLFGYPADDAATAAVDAVRRWLALHPASDLSVVFNTFTPEDDAHYRAILPSSAVVAPPSGPSPALALAADLVARADYLLISAGAGLSAAAGLDYTSEEVFKKHHPVMHARGFKNMYQFIGYSDWSEALQWGYLFSQIRLARFEWQPTTPVYTHLKQLFDHFDQRASHTDDNNEPASSNTNNTTTNNPTPRAFVVTSNVDGLFLQHNFPTPRVLPTQGDYATLQCLRPCSRDSHWPTLPALRAALAPPNFDPSTYELTNPAAVPRCPRCAGPAVPNVRGGSWFLAHLQNPMREAYKQWIETVVDEVRRNGKRLVVLEIGAGWNTPGVLRWPNEALAEENPGGAVALVRINRDHCEVPFDLEDAVGVAGDAAEAVRFIVESVVRG
ncbi:hypothetical protein DFJ73DRAFT_665823 [Zopfochytrium polystomum]|nr:hypothetical protein DFJ73DRAFT_665823 [Zopfochytrium polystomum]